MTAFAAIALAGLLLLLVCVLALIGYTHGHIRQRVSSLTPYTTRHGDELQTRLDNVTATSAAHRETITRELRQYDIGMSAETRAMRAALAAEQERKQHATHVPDNR